MNRMRKALTAAVLGLGLVLSPVAVAGPVNINTADVQTLDRELEGIGKKLAERIVAYREENGPFRRPDEIKRVPYVGDRTYEKNADRIRVN